MNCIVGIQKIDIGELISVFIRLRSFFARNHYDDRAEDIARLIEQLRNRDERVIDELLGSCFWSGAEGAYFTFTAYQYVPGIVIEDPAQEDKEYAGLILEVVRILRRAGFDRPTSFAIFRMPFEILERHFKREAERPLVRSAELISRLMDTLQHNPDLKILAQTCLSLGKTKDPDALVPLQAALTNPDPLFRYWAIIGLSITADPRVIPLIIDALKDDDAKVRGCAANELGDRLDERALNPLKDVYLHDEDEEVRKEAQSAFERITRILGYRG